MNKNKNIKKLKNNIEKLRLMNKNKNKKIIKMIIKKNIEKT